MNQLSAVDLSQSSRSPSWKWMLCLVLLSATLLNYSHRFAFTENSHRVQEDFETNKAGYGEVAGQFSLGFAFGALVFGVLADWVSVRWLYPVVVIVWSLAGVASGMVTTLDGLGNSRFILGLFAAGHWPCALRTTQRAFNPAERTLANSILQAGASIGACLTPLLVIVVARWYPDGWRLTFFLVGGLGIPWAIWWWLTVSEADVRRPVVQTDEVSTGPGEERELEEIPFFRIFLTRRWWLLLLIINFINLPWHYVRVWMPDTLQADHGYDPEFVGFFRSAYYLLTFFGSLVSGWMILRLSRSGWNVHRARLIVFLVFAILSTFSIVAAFAPKGMLLLGSLLVVAFGSLGLFPIYYSLNQEISAKHQGKVGGSLGFTTWGILYFVHPAVGELVDGNPTIRPYIFAGVGLGPLLAFAVLALFWGRRPVERET
jgi:ACS family hexuronate transporter-like MFS transporter